MANSRPKWKCRHCKKFFMATLSKNGLCYNCEPDRIETEMDGRITVIEENTNETVEMLRIKLEIEKVKLAQKQEETKQEKEKTKQEQIKKSMNPEPLKYGKHIRLSPNHSEGSSQLGSVEEVEQLNENLTDNYTNWFRPRTQTAIF